MKRTNESENNINNLDREFTICKKCQNGWLLPQRELLEVPSDVGYTILMCSNEECRDRNIKYFPIVVKKYRKEYGSLR